MIAVYEERYAEARSLFEEALRLNVEIGDTWTVALGHNNLGNASRGLADSAAARRHYAEALRVYAEYDDRWALAFLLEDIAQLAAVAQPRAAVELLGATDRMRDELDAPRPESRVAELTARFLPDDVGLGVGEQERLRAGGRELSVAAAVELAVSVCA
jgi:tetratricopeptide (TPR) repeat protein